MPSTSRSAKHLYYFGNKTAGGHGGLASLGGKSADLPEMARIGLPVPLGFTIATEVCMYSHANHRSYPSNLNAQVKAGVVFLEQSMGFKFGDAGKVLQLVCALGLARLNAVSSALRRLPLPAALFCALLANEGRAQFIPTGAGPWDYNTAANWSANTINGNFTQAPSAAQTVTFGANSSLATALTFNLGGTSPGLTLRGTGADRTMTLGGAVTVNGANNSSITFGSSTTGQKLNVVLGADRTFTVDSGNTLTVLNVVSGANALTKAGAGTLTLSGVNTYTGATTINGGTLTVSADSRLGAVPAATTAGQLTLNGGTLNSSAAFTLNSKRGILLGASGGVFNTNSGANITYGGVIAGSGALTKIGSGALFLSGANTYTGATVIKGGNLVLNASNVLPSTSNVTLIASTFQLAAGQTQTIGALALGGPGGASASNASVFMGAGATLTLGGNVTFDPTGNPEGARLWAGGSLDLGSATTRTFDIGDSTGGYVDLYFEQVATGTGGFTKTGLGLLRFENSSSHTYAGDTVVNNGVLSLARSNTLPASNNVVVRATTPGGEAKLNLWPFWGAVSQTIGTLTLGGSSNSTSGVEIDTGCTLTLGGNVTFDATDNPRHSSIGDGTLDLGGATRTFDVGHSSNAEPTYGVDLVVGAVISGTAGGIIKTGLGSLFLVGQGDFVGINTYDGPTHVNGGTLGIGADSALGVAPSSPVAGKLTLDGGTLLGLTSFTLNPNRGITLGSGGGAINEFNSAETLTYGGIIAGAGALTKAGPGTLLLTGVNSYTGGTTVNNGTLKFTGANISVGNVNVTGNTSFLQIGATNTLPAATNLTLNGGALVQGGAYSNTLGTLTLTANSIIDFGGAAGTISFGDSHSTTWTAGATLSVINYAVSSHIYFGSDNTALSSSQLAQVYINGQSVAWLNSGGELTISAIPEPSAYAALAGIAFLCAALCRRYKRMTKAAKTRL